MALEDYNAESDMSLNETDVFVEELMAFNQFWEHLLRVYQPFEIFVLAVGIIGNLLALITFARSRKMCTPSFVYHRALVAADLLFCGNVFTNLAVDRWLMVECRQYIFRYWFGAFFSGTLNPVITSACGYLIDYTTILIALDRFLALVSATGFQRWNTPRVAWRVTCSAVFLSCVVHSWPLFVQTVVVSYALDQQQDDPLIWQPICWNDTVVYHWTKQDNVSQALQTAINVKEIYNRVARMAYPIVLSLLTLGVIVGIIRRQRRREGIRRLARNSNVSLDGLESAALAPERYRWNAGVSPNRSNIMRKRRRCERALFLLMTAVLLLAFVQVGASEARHLLQLVHPPDIILRTKVADASLALDDRLWYFKFILYGHQASKVFSNAATVIERSFICILYMIMNKLFRRELLAMISECVCYGPRGRRFRSRFDSNLPAGDPDNFRTGGLELLTAAPEAASYSRRDISINL